MSDLENILFLFHEHIIKILMIILIFSILLSLLHFFNVFGINGDSRLKQNVNDAIKFPGFPNDSETILTGETVESEIIDKNKNSHILLYGASGSGKTYFIKQYLKKNNLFNPEKLKVFCLDEDEWDSDYIERDLTKLSNLEQLKGYTIVLDDKANEGIDKYVSNIISKGRHFNIQLIFLAHLAVDLNPKSRNNVSEIYITTNNTPAFFSDLKEKFKSPFNFSNFNYVEHGIIRYKLTKGSFLVYDKNYKQIYDSSSNKLSTRSDINFNNFLNRSEFSDIEKSEITHFLESQSEINITDPLFLFYLNYYLIQKGYKVNKSKLKHLISDYQEEHSNFKTDKIMPLIRNIRYGYDIAIKGK